MKSVPCGNCEERSIGCHGKCEKYIEFRRDRDTMLDRRTEIRNTDDAIRDHRKERIDRIRRRNR